MHRGGRSLRRQLLYQLQRHHFACDLGEALRAADDLHEAVRIDLDDVAGGYTSLHPRLMTATRARQVCRPSGSQT